MFFHNLAKFFRSRRIHRQDPSHIYKNHGDITRINIPDQQRLCTEGKIHVHVRPVSLYKRSKADMFHSGPQTFVKITVGTDPDTQTFSILKSLVCHKSPFFRAAFEGSFSEAESQTMTLEDVEPKIFGLMVDWLYTQKVEKEFGRLYFHESGIYRS